MSDISLTEFGTMAQTLFEYAKEHFRYEMLDALGRNPYSLFNAKCYKKEELFDALINGQHYCQRMHLMPNHLDEYAIAGIWTNIDKDSAEKIKGKFPHLSSVIDCMTFEDDKYNIIIFGDEGDIFWAEEDKAEDYPQVLDFLHDVEDNEDDYASLILGDSEIFVSRFKEYEMDWFFDNYEEEPEDEKSDENESSGMIKQWW